MRSLIILFLREQALNLLHDSKALDPKIPISSKDSTRESPSDLFLFANQAEIIPKRRPEPMLWHRDELPCGCAF
jgi:hypothetical protein